MSVRLLVLAAAALPLAPLHAQYLNRAVWLGFEEEGVRRDYEQRVEYFLDRASYVDPLPWDRGATLDPFGDRFQLVGGSVAGDRLTVEGVGNARLPLDDTFDLGVHYLQSEHQGTQFLRFGPSLTAAFSDRTAGFLLLEGTPQKDRADFTVGLELFRGTGHTQRIGVTMVDFAARKSNTIEYVRRPLGLMASGFGGSAASVEFAYEIAAQLPFEERRLDDGQRLRMHRAIGSFELRIRMAARDRLLLHGEGELSDKRLRPDDPGGALQEDYDAEFGRLRAEWWRDVGDGSHLAIGGWYLHQATDGDRPNDPAQDLRERRREAMLSLRTRLWTGERWALEPYVIGGHVRREVEAFAGTGPDREVFDGFQGKWGVPLRYRFSQTAFLRFDVSMQLDELEFAGGGVQFSAVF